MDACTGSESRRLPSRSITGHSLVPTEPFQAIVGGNLVFSPPYVGRSSITHYSPLPPSPDRPRFLLDNAASNWSVRTMAFLTMADDKCRSIEGSRVKLTPSSAFRARFILSRRIDAIRRGGPHPTSVSQAADPSSPPCLTRARSPECSSPQPRGSGVDWSRSEGDHRGVACLDIKLLELQAGVCRCTDHVLRFLFFFLPRPRPSVHLEMPIMPRL